MFLNLCILLISIEYLPVKVLLCCNTAEVAGSFVYSDGFIQFKLDKNNGPSMFPKS